MDRKGKKPVGFNKPGTKKATPTKNGVSDELRQQYQRNERRIEEILRIKKNGGGKLSETLRRELQSCYNFRNVHKAKFQ